MKMNDVTRVLKRLFGSMCIIIGISLLWNGVAALPEIVANSQGARDITAMMVFGLAGLLLIGMGGLLVFKPDLTKGL